MEVDGDATTVNLVSFFLDRPFPPWSLLRGPVWRRRPPRATYRGLVSSWRRDRIFEAGGAGTFAGSCLLRIDVILLSLSLSSLLGSFGCDGSIMSLYVFSHSRSTWTFPWISFSHSCAILQVSSDGESFTVPLAVAKMSELVKNTALDGE